MCNEGPLVSLKGSPTVSPTTVALWTSEPLPPSAPVSTSFFALSQAPPAFDIITAMTKPVAKPPDSSPRTPATPKIRPTTTGIRIAKVAGFIISFWAPLVEISTHRA